MFQVLSVTDLTWRNVSGVRVWIQATLSLDHFREFQMKLSLVVVASVLLTLSCGKKYETNTTTPGAAAPGATAFTYTNGAKAIIDAKCVNCHAAGKEYADLPLVTLAQISAKKDSIKARINLAASPMPPKNRTPPVPQLTDAEKTALTSWVDAGAPQ
jgi:uncharacterized membrane protein